MTSRMMEIYDFARMEPEATEDLTEMMRECWPVEIDAIEKVGINLTDAARNVKEEKFDRRSL